MFLFFENLYYGYFSSTLDAFSLLSIISAAVVIIIKNPIASIMCLIVLFSSVSGFLICIGLGFIGLAYLLVYIGAVSILFLFILMLINVRVSELISETKNSIPLVFYITFLFISASPVIFYNAVTTSDWSSFLDKFANTIAHRNWEDTLLVLNDITCVGYVLYSIYAILLILASLILLLSLVGAVAITVKEKLSKYPVTKPIMHSNLFASLLRGYPKPHTFIELPLQSAVFENGITIRFVLRLFTALLTGLILRSIIHSDLNMSIFGECLSSLSLILYSIFFISAVALEWIFDTTDSTKAILDAPRVNFMKRPGSPLESGSSKIGRYESPSPEASTPVAPAPIAPAPIAPTPVAPTPVAPTPVAPTPIAPTPIASAPLVDDSDVSSSPETSDSEESPSMPASVPASPEYNQESDRSDTQSPEEGTEYLTDNGWLVVQSISAVEDEAENRAMMKDLSNTDSPDKNDLHELAYYIELAHARTTYNPATNPSIRDHIVNHMGSDEAQARLTEADKGEVNPFYLPRDDNSNN